MPIALLIQNLVKVFADGVRSVSSWDQLVTLETTLLGRARGAFLVHWFGPHIPMAASAVRVHIDNLEALRTRYHAVAAGARADGPNLAEPLAGMTGMLFGQLSSPINSMVLYALVDRYMQKWYYTLLAALNAMTFGVLGSAIALVAGAASPLAIPLLLTSDTVRAAYDFLGAFASLIPAFVRFWHIVSGAEPARNPLLREMLEIGHQLATLLPFVFAMFAFLVVHTTRIMRPLAVQLPLFRALIESVMDVIGFVLDNFIDHIKALYEGENSAKAAILHVVHALQRAMGVIGDQLTAVFGRLSQASQGWIDAMAGGFRVWLARALPAILAATTKHPVVEFFLAAARSLGAVAAIFRARPSPPSPPSSPGVFTRGLTAVFGAAPPTPSLTLPDVPALEAAAGGVPPLPRATLGDSLEWAAGLFRDLRAVGLLADPFALSREAGRRLRHARYPGSVFRAERDALVEPARQAREEELRYRDLLFEAVGRTLPPQAAEKVQQLAPVFDALDRALNRTPRAEADRTVAFPVLDVPESDALIPAVTRLRIRVPGGNESQAREWGLRLKGALLAQPYAAPAGV